MRYWRKKSLAVLVIGVMSLALAASPVLAAEEMAVAERTTDGMIFDAVFLRPLGLLGIVAGSAVFVLSLPFSATSGNVNEAVEKLVVKPARFTFTRPLGQLEYPK